MYSVALDSLPPSQHFTELCAFQPNSPKKKSEAGRTLNIPQKLRSPSSKLPRKLENVTQPTTMFAQVTELNVNGDLLVD